MLIRKNFGVLSFLLALLVVLLVVPCSWADEGDSGDGSSEGSDGDSSDIITFFARGDGTRGRFGSVKVTGTMAQSDWYRLDQQARHSLKDGDLASAENLFKQAIQAAEAHQQVEPGYINSMVGLSFLYHKKRNFAESDRVYEYAMRNMEGLAGRNSARFADYMDDLAWLYNQHSKPDKAEVLFKHAISIREKTFGEHSSELSSSLQEYAQFLHKNNREGEARLVEARIQMIRDRRAE